MRADAATLRAALVVGVTPFLVALLLSAVVAVLGAHELEADSALVMTALLTCAAFGADQLQSGEAGSTAIGQLPLLVTLVSLTAAVLVLRRVQRRFARARRAVAVAAVAAAVHGLLLAALAAPLRAGVPALDGYRSDSNAHVAATGLVLQNGETTVSVAAAAGLGFLAVLAPLLGTVALRPGWTHPVAVGLRRWLAAPAVGLGVLVAGTVFAGTVYLVAILVGDETTRGPWQAATLVAVLPALGVRLLALGAGAEVGYTYEGGGRIEDLEQRLPEFAAAHGALFWLAPPVLLLVLGAAVAMVVWRATGSDAVLRSVAVHVALLPLALPLASRLANIHGHGVLEIFGTPTSFSFSGGVSALAFTVSATAISAVLAVLVVVLSGNLDRSRIRDRVRRMAAVETWQ